MKLVSVICVGVYLHSIGQQTPGPGLLVLVYQASLGIPPESTVVTLNSTEFLKYASELSMESPNRPFRRLGCPTDKEDRLLSESKAQLIVIIRHFQPVVEVIPDVVHNVAL